jgi:hypothetical protein
MHVIGAQNRDSTAEILAVPNDDALTPRHADEGFEMHG